MNENSRYAVGVDVGTSYIRCVVASLDNEGKPRIVGCSQVENSGMKKGVISHLAGPNKALEKALSEVEGISGYNIKKACFTGSVFTLNKIKTGKGKFGIQIFKKKFIFFISKP